jgi:hypothetical protein
LIPPALRPPRTARRSPSVPQIITRRYRSRTTSSDHTPGSVHPSRPKPPPIPSRVGGPHRRPGSTARAAAQPTPRGSGGRAICRRELLLPETWPPCPGPRRRRSATVPAAAALPGTARSKSPAAMLPTAAPPAGDGRQRRQELVPPDRGQVLRRPQLAGVNRQVEQPAQGRPAFARVIWAWHFRHSVPLEEQT